MKINIENFQNIPQSVQEAIDLVLSCDFEPEEIMRKIQWTLKDEKTQYMGDMNIKNLFGWHLMKADSAKTISWLSEMVQKGEKNKWDMCWNDNSMCDFLEGAVPWAYKEGSPDDLKKILHVSNRIAKIYPESHFSIFNIGYTGVTLEMIGSRGEPEDTKKLKILIDGAMDHRQWRDHTFLSGLIYNNRIECLRLLVDKDQEAFSYLMNMPAGNSLPYLKYGNKTKKEEEILSSTSALRRPFWISFVQKEQGIDELWNFFVDNMSAENHEKWIERELDIIIEHQKKSGWVDPPQAVELIDTVLCGREQDKASRLVCEWIEQGFAPLTKAKWEADILRGHTQGCGATQKARKI